jgi:hypothetical protein
MPVHREVNHQFFKKWSPAMAYVLGFFAADGTMTTNKHGSQYVALHITDLELLESIRGLMGSNHKIATRVRGGNCKLGYRIQIGSRELYNNLHELGFTENKSNTILFPQVPKKYVGEFVRGYFDGDGCVYFNVLQVKDRKNPKPIFQTKFTSGCRTFLESLLAVLREHGIRGGYLVAKQHGRGYELALSHRDSLAIYQLMYNNAPTCGVYLERKKTKFDHAIRIMYAGVA